MEFIKRGEATKTLGICYQTLYKMAERNKNIFKRQLISFNPNFRIDTANPQMGQSGTDVYKIYGVTDSGDNQSSISLSSGGLFSIYNDHTKH